MSTLLSSCLLPGTSFSWLASRWTNEILLRWERIECAIQGASSYASSIKTGKNWLVVMMERART